LACELTEYYGVSNPSMPNYLAAVSGQYANEPDPTCPLGLSGTTIGDLLVEKGLTWKNYAEDFPSNPCTGCNSGLYAPRHVPFTMFTKDCSSVVTFSELQTDVKALPTYIWISPNLYDCGHTLDGTNCLGTSNRLTQFDCWLKNTLWPILKNNVATDTVLFITFDTGANSYQNTACNSTSGGKVTTFVVGPSTIVNQNTALSTGPYNHYSLLAMVEKIFGTGNLGECDASAATFDGAFVSTPPPPKTVILKASATIA
jgi:phospholipase C